MYTCFRPHCAIRHHNHDITFANFLRLSTKHCDLSNTKTSIKNIDNKGFIDDYILLSKSWSGDVRVCLLIIRKRLREIENEKCTISRRLRIIYLFSLVETEKIKILRKMYTNFDQAIKNKYNQMKYELAYEEDPDEINV